MQPHAEKQKGRLGFPGRPSIVSAYQAEVYSRTSEGFRLTGCQWPTMDHSRHDSAMRILRSAPVFVNVMVNIVLFFDSFRVSRQVLCWRQSTSSLLPTRFAPAVSGA